MLRQGAVLCEGDFPETTSTKNKFASNCSCWTLISMLWQYMERWIYFTWNSTFCHSARDSGRTSPVHSRHSCNEWYIEEIVHCATTSQKLLAHHNDAGTSELSDVAARSQGMNRCSGHASSVNIIHWGVGASVRHLCSVYLSRMRVLFNLTVIPVVRGSYYRNVICIARSVGVGANWVVCYLKGCNMSRLCLDEYFSLFCIWHYCNFHSKN